RVVAQVHRAEAAGPQRAPHPVAPERRRGGPIRRRRGRLARLAGRGLIRLTPRPWHADGRACRRGIRVHGGIARRLSREGFVRWVQCQRLLAPRGASTPFVRSEGRAPGDVAFGDPRQESADDGGFILTASLNLLPETGQPIGCVGPTRPLETSRTGS